ncbi:MAG: hypothetical protein QM520_06175, partial [Gammaproteobacteria bacterium]|nr:hypothetical protein [Gammaproteobacteria bacterium]
WTQAEGIIHAMRDEQQVWLSKILLYEAMGEVPETFLSDLETRLLQHPQNCLLKEKLSQLYVLKNQLIPATLKKAESFACRYQYTSAIESLSELKNKFSNLVPSGQYKVWQAIFESKIQDYQRQQIDGF